MKTITRISASVATAGLLAFGVAGTANAAADGQFSADANCYHAAQKPWIVGGVGRTAAGSATVYCLGGTARIRIDVKLQKKVGARWVNQNPYTYCVGVIGRQTKKCTETNPSSVGLWRTWSKAQVMPRGDFNIAISGTTRFVPARTGGVTQ